MTEKTEKKQGRSVVVKDTEPSGRTYPHLEMMNFQHFLSCIPKGKRDTPWFIKK